MASYKAYKPTEKISSQIKSIDLLEQTQRQQEKFMVMVGNGTENSIITLYTVPTGKKFIWQGIAFQNSCNVGVAGQGYISVGGVDKFGLLGQPLTNPILQLVFPEPFIYPAGTLFKLRSEIAGSIVYATIFGYLVDF